MKFILFGDIGYLGSHINKLISELGHEVYIPNLINNNRLNLVDKNNLINVDWNVDFVLHFAGKTGTADSFSNYSDFILNNEIVLLNILDSIRNSKYRPRVVFPSTRLVYKGSDLPVNVNAEKSPKTVYAVNKLSCEYYLTTYEKIFNIPFSIFRISVPYGNLINEKYSFGTIGNLIKQSREGKILIYGNGQVMRTFTHVEDIARIVLFSCFCKETINKTFNVPGENYSLHDIAKLVSGKFSSSIELIEYPKFDALIESGSTIFDGSDLLDLIKIKPKHDFHSWLNTF